MLVPATSAFAIPLVLPIVATVVLLLLHVPPVTASVRLEVLPVHTFSVPVIGAVGFTVIVLVAEVELPQASVDVTVYVVVTLGVSVTDAPGVAPGIHT